MGYTLLYQFIIIIIIVNLLRATNEDNKDNKDKVYRINKEIISTINMNKSTINNTKILYNVNENILLLTNTPEENGSRVVQPDVVNEINEELQHHNIKSEELHTKKKSLKENINETFLLYNVNNKMSITNGSTEGVINDSITNPAFDAQNHTLFPSKYEHSITIPIFEAKEPTENVQSKYEHSITIPIFEAKEPTENVQSKYEPSITIPIFEANEPTQNVQSKYKHSTKPFFEKKASTQNIHSDSKDSTNSVIEKISIQIIQSESERSTEPIFEANKLTQDIPSIHKDSTVPIFEVKNHPQNIQSEYGHLTEPIFEGNKLTQDIPSKHKPITSSYKKERSSLFTSRLPTKLTTSKWNINNQIIKELSKTKLKLDNKLNNTYNKVKFIQSTPTILDNIRTTTSDDDAPLPSTKDDRRRQKNMNYTYSGGPVKRYAPPSGFRVANVNLRESSSISARFIELYVVADKSFYSFCNKDEYEVRKRVADIINIVNYIFQDLGIVVVLTYLDIWKYTNKIEVISNDHERLLDLFQGHRKKLISEGLLHDHTMLMTREDFVGNTVGFASTKGMCDYGISASLVRVSNDIPRPIAITAAHELGHSLGMTHDDECLPGQSSIMNAESRTVQLKWSDCSRKELSKTLDYFWCLKNEPNETLGYIRSMCGNGLLEGIEQCDCGPVGHCNNSCCNPLDCTLHKNASCASGLCCNIQSCSLEDPGLVCRNSQHECDLPEYCTGYSEVCPNDVHKADGITCDGAKGHCWSGECGSHDRLCKLLLGPTSRGGPEKCYKRNKEGTKNHNCGHRFIGTKISYNKCSEQSQLCGSVFCEFGGNVKMSTYYTKNWGYSRIGNCYVKVPYSEYHHYTLSMDGSTCGNNKVCVDQKCQNNPWVKGHTCVGGCGGHGICNNRGHCHCDLGYDPPDCVNPGHGGSIDSGYATDPSYVVDFQMIVFLTFIVIVPFIVAICCAWSNAKLWWDRTGHQAVSSVCPCCSSCLDSCCCPILVKIATFFPLHKFDEKVDSGTDTNVNLPEPDSDGDIQINVDVKPIETATSWGLADSRLITDVIVITPTNSPDIKRKIRIGSESPKKIHRPKYTQTMSKDSGCVSEDEPSHNRDSKLSSSISMSSLIGVIVKFGKQFSGSSDGEMQGQPSSTRCQSIEPRGKSMEPDQGLHKMPFKQKSVPLSRMVVDPLLIHQRSVPNNNSVNNKSEYKRSISSDATSHNRINKLDGSKSLLNKSSKHKSEDNLLEQSNHNENASHMQIDSKRQWFNSSNDSNKPINKQLKIPKIPQKLNDKDKSASPEVKKWGSSSSERTSTESIIQIKRNYSEPSIQESEYTNIVPKSTISPSKSTHLWRTERTPKVVEQSITDKDNLSNQHKIAKFPPKLSFGGELPKQHNDAKLPPKLSPDGKLAPQQNDAILPIKLTQKGKLLKQQKVAMLPPGIPSVMTNTNLTNTQTSPHHSGFKLKKTQIESKENKTEPKNNVKDLVSKLNKTNTH